MRRRSPRRSDALGLAALVAGLAVAAIACSSCRPDPGTQPGPQTASGSPSGAPTTAPTPTAAQSAPMAPDAGSATIGTATMDPDGTIVLQLRAEGPGGLVGDAQIRYPPSHKDYQDVLKHLGGLKPGESKPVPPWPD